jgi:RNA ligase
MKKLIDLLEDKELQKRYEGILKIVQGPGDLYLFNYTDECQHRGLWDDVTILCRGVMIDKKTKEVAARPFEKFFNWHEYKQEIPEEPFVVTEKVDGSLGILYRHDGQYFLATRGSFTSVEAKRGTRLLRESLGEQQLPEEYTFLFEIILSDAGSTVVKYDFDGLFLLGVINRHTGEELPQEMLSEWTNRFGWRLPKRYMFGTKEEVHASRASLPADLEGYVLRFQSGLRLKLKSEAYLAVLRSSLGLSRSKVITALSQGEKEYQALLEQTPEELIPFAEKIAAEVREQVARCNEEAKLWFEKAPRETRKDFALWVQQNVPAEYKGALFMMLDGRTPSWYEKIANPTNV